MKWNSCVKKFLRRQFGDIVVNVETRGLDESRLDYITDKKSHLLHLDMFAETVVIINHD